MSFIRGYDHESLRERVDLDECAARLEEIDGQRSLPAPVSYTHLTLPTKA